MAAMTPRPPGRAGIRRHLAPVLALIAVGCASPFLPKPTLTPSQPGTPVAPEPPRKTTRPPTVPSTWRGVWLNHDMMAEGAAALTRSLNLFADAGINVVYPNVWFRGKVLYPGSKFAPQDSRFAGWDPLETVAAEAHRRGMKVLPWFEYGFITHFNTTGDPRDVGAVLSAHPDWAAVDRAGNVGLLHTDHKVYFYSLSPAVPAARAWLRDLVLEAARHSKVDGIQLDRIRYPYQNTSYDTYSREAFKAVKADPLTLPEDDPDWVAWREKQVTTFMAEFEQEAARVIPGMPITSAVLPSSANKAHYQDWAAWCAAGYLDVATPLNFNASHAYVENEVAFARQSVAGSATALVMGLAAMHAGEANLGKQVEAATGVGAGVALWDDKWARDHLDAVKAALAD